MTYQQTVDYLYTRLPMFSRIGSPALKKDLGNTLELCKRLGDPQHNFRTVHVAGTNGKGSVSHMLAAILQTAGYKTGLYTSPHLKDFRERIRINGRMISEDQVILFTESQRQNIEEIEPSFFELTVAMAFDYFSREKVDVAIIEVGLGGRLDSTNVIIPELSVITNISYDHVNILGHTLPEIAFEKAGIIKPEVPVVIGEYQEEVKDVFLKRAQEMHSPLSFAAKEWSVSTLPGGSPEMLPVRVKPIIVPESSGLLSLPESLELDLTGLYQLKNIKTVLSSILRLNARGYGIQGNAIVEALKNVKGLTGLMGRWQVLSKKPLIICDTGHNEGGIQEVLKNIREIPFHALHIVLGMVKDKDSSTVLSLLPKDACFYFCQPSIERAKPAKVLAEEARLEGLTGTYYPSVAEALKAAKYAAEENDLIYVGGSTFVVAEVV